MRGIALPGRSGFPTNEEMLALIQRAVDGIQEAIERGIDASSDDEESSDEEGDGQMPVAPRAVDEDDEYMTELFRDNGI